MNVCKNIKALKPYKSGKHIDELQRELGLNSITKLASNERVIPISKKIKNTIIATLDNIHRYPDNNGFILKQALTKQLNIEISKIILGNGSSDILQLAAKICVCNKDDEIIFAEYAFALYALISQSLGAKSVCVPSENYGHNLSAMLAAISNKTKLIYIANPNNPTGTFLTDVNIYDFLTQVPKSVLVVLDEAYFEYVDNYETLHFLDEFDNLVITRTFSKAYGLAGLRVGYGIASDDIIDYLNRIRSPFNVTELAQLAAVSALADKVSLKKAIKLNNEGLIQLRNGITALGLNYIPSKTNFISVKVKNAPTIYKELLSKGFIIRPIEIPNFIRISVGTFEENKRFLIALKQVL